MGVSPADHTLLSTIGMPSVYISALVPHIDLVVFGWVDPMNTQIFFFFAARVDKVIFVELLVNTRHVNTSLFECGRYLMRSTL